MELNVASEKDIMDELKRREMIRADTKIKERVMAIDYAYNRGGIARIEIVEESKGTSVATTKYIVFLK